MAWRQERETEPWHEKAAKALGSGWTIRHFDEVPKERVVFKRPLFRDHWATSAVKGDVGIRFESTSNPSAAILVKAKGKEGHLASYRIDLAGNLKTVFERVPQGGLPKTLELLQKAHHLLTKYAPKRK